MNWKNINKETKNKIRDEIRVIDATVSIRQTLRESKNWEVADDIRKKLLELGVVVKDTKDGSTWEYIDSTEERKIWVEQKGGYYWPHEIQKMKSESNERTIPHLPIAEFNRK
jgi:hypothetical protein